MFSFLLKIYKKIKRYSSFSVCRYYPSCSDYASEAVKKYGEIKGFWLSAKRILRCNQFFPGGYDPLV